jgi:hypothetical protein
VTAPDTKPGKDSGMFVGHRPRQISFVQLVADVSPTIPGPGQETPDAIGYFREDTPDRILVIRQKHLE